MQRTSFQPGSVLSFWAVQYRSELARRSMKGVPGVMAFESHASLVSEVISLPIAGSESEWGSASHAEDTTHPSILLRLVNVPRTFHALPGQSGIVGTVADSSSPLGQLHLRKKHYFLVKLELHGQLTDCHEEQFPRSNHAHDPFRVLEYFYHHLLLSLWSGFSFRVRTRVNLHIQVKILATFSNPTPFGNVQCRSYPDRGYRIPYR